MTTPHTVPAAAAHIVAIYEAMSPEARVHWAGNINVSLTRLQSVVGLCRVLAHGKSHKQYAQAEAALRAQSPRLWAALHG